MPESVTRRNWYQISMTHVPEIGARNTESLALVSIACIMGLRQHSQSSIGNEHMSL